MGCGGSKSETQVSTQRRRLSVGEVDKDAKDAMNEAAVEGDRGLISELQAEDVIKMLGDVGGRKFSLGSATDQSKTSFSNKTMQELGEKIDPSESFLGYTCRKGLKPESPNQDSWSILKVDGDYSIYGVYDGHGKTGHDVSNFVKDNLPKLIIKDQRFKTSEMPEMLKDNFKKTQSLVGTMDRTKKLSAQMAGTTCSIVIHNHNESKLTIAHVADSTVVLGTYASKADKEKGAEAKFTAKALTRDHKPDLKDEKARITKAGGRVVFDGYANHRVYAKNGRYPGLNMSRCLGDLLGHQEAGCSCEPEVSEHKIDDLDYCLLVCSDGVWEFIEPLSAVQIVSQFGKKDAMKAAETLAKEAWDRWIKEEGGSVVDDITVILVHLSVEGKNNDNSAPGA